MIFKQAKSATYAVLFSFVLLANQVLAGGDHAHHHVEEQAPTGPNGGKLLSQGELTLEVVLLENANPGSFRIYPSMHHEPINPDTLTLNMQLKRLGDTPQNIPFSAKHDHLKSDKAITQPHSFEVFIAALYQGKSYQWQFEHFEGRTHIESAMAEQLAITTEQVGNQTLIETLDVFGQLTLKPNAARHINAPYSGLITQLNVELGQVVTKGQVLMTIKSNESLQSYQITAPINGLVTEQNIAQGEQTHIEASNESLLTIVDTQQLVAEVAVFAKDQAKVKVGQKVNLQIGEQRLEGKLDQRVFGLSAQQAKTYRIFIDNQQGLLHSGQFVKAQIETGRFEVQKAVKRQAIQKLQAHPVVFHKVGEYYQAVKLKLGRQDAIWAEVIDADDGVIELGANYVTENAYLIKADIEKSGVAHAH
ncbi:efflux RND transporter periplasmic adaptor subunit [Catenovulum sp. SM1970]|uniref:efflux RND transporter periplasmic adaptor subunit n=1 Tax=Marinifaba aquimaris TaxID=2741323 RepID=UPI001571AA79|nr:HlyD family efflux transporter periplasmic adaptor subunit [Marinifaba aquimaris]NTS77197.1 efflux RND transporter periplasmic adaptor subunit [Marinifaba aquimaris]